MSKQKTAPKTARAKSAKTVAGRKGAPALPYELRLLGSMLGGTQAQTRRAIDAARQSLERYMTSRDENGRADIAGSFDYYVQDYAIKDCRESVEKALDAIGGEGNFGDLVSAYSYPGYLAGMAFTWLMLRGDVTTGGAR